MQVADFIELEKSLGAYGSYLLSHLLLLAPHIWKPSFRQSAHPLELLLQSLYSCYSCAYSCAYSCNSMHRISQEYQLLQGRPSASIQIYTYGAPADATVAIAGELRSTGDKGHRVLLANVLPRLSQYQALPPALIPQLIQLSGSEDRQAPLPFSFLSKKKLNCPTWLLVLVGCSC